MIIRAACAHHCPFCVQHSRHPPRPVAATPLHAPMRCLDNDNVRQHPRTKRKSQGTCIVCCFTHQPVIVIHQTGEPSVERRNCSAKEVICALTLRWLPHFGRPRFGWLSEQRILGSTHNLLQRSSTAAMWRERYRLSRMMRHVSHSK